ncbi:MAG: hypothetical protein NZM65_08935 [Flavobacteriales bacterium]|nr:hypothetical protein [Flavobacteriales bacterium]MDW8410796.1 hypothetical protein [Flavobacteriales bacterium]
MPNTLKGATRWGVIGVMWMFACREKTQAPVPAWLQIDSVGMTTHYPTQGTPHQNFKDVWVYLNGRLLGAFELPFRVPVLSFGQVDVLLRPGIFVNGFAGLRAQYAPIKFLSLKRTFKPDSVTHIYPVFQYDSLVTFPFLEDFEPSGIQFTASPGSASNLVRMSGPGAGFLSNACGLLELPANSAQPAQTETINTIYLPKGGRPKIMEFHYKCNTPVDVLLVCFTSSGLRSEKYILTLKSTQDVWNKVYITLTPFTDSFQEGNLFKPSFRIPASAKEDNPFLALDNIKILY